MGFSKEEFLTYLGNTRGLTQEMIKQFRVGFYEKSRYRGFYETVPGVQSKLSLKSDNSIVFPVFDLYGQVIAVLANLLSKNRDVKYKLSWGADRERCLYGLDVTWKDILDKEEVVVVEGSFDLLTLYQNGIRNVVAVLGSVLFFRQLCTLLRFTEKLVLAFDGDKAGKVTLQKASILLRNRGIKYDVIQLPDGDDPDSYIRNFGVSKFLALRRYGEFDLPSLS